MNCYVPYPYIVILILRFYIPYPFFCYKNVLATLDLPSYRHRLIPINNFLTRSSEIYTYKAII